MRKLVTIFVAVILSFTVSAQSLDALKGLATSSDAAKSAMDSMGGSVSGILQSQLGVNEDQADGGIGSMLTLANEKLQAGEFDQLAGMVPGAEGYMEKAKSLGAVDGPLKDLEGLNNALGSLGISPETVSKFVPTATDYLGKLGGSDMTGLLTKAFGAAM